MVPWEPCHREDENADVGGNAGADEYADAGVGALWIPDLKRDCSKMAVCSLNGVLASDSAPLLAPFHDLQSKNKYKMMRNIKLNLIISFRHFNTQVLCTETVLKWTFADLQLLLNR